jgi:hypothetical protein
MSARYTADGRRRSSMTHAGHTWTCPCGRTVRGNGGKSSHQRSCQVWAAEALRVAEAMLAHWSEPNARAAYSSAAWIRRRYAAERDQLQERLKEASR